MAKRSGYTRYLRTNRWQTKRELAFASHGKRCATCGHEGSKQNPLHVHHKTYERFGGRELLEDLQILCEKCHKKLHQKKQPKAKKVKKPKIKQRAKKPARPAQQKRKHLQKRDGTPPELQEKYEERRRIKRAEREALRANSEKFLN